MDRDNSECRRSTCEDVDLFHVCAQQQWRLHVVHRVMNYYYPHIREAECDISA